MWNSAFRLFSNRNFALYFGGQAISSLGDNFYGVAVILAVLQATHSPTAGAMVLMASAIPMVLFMLLGGIFGDRLPRNRVMIAADVVRAISQFAMAGLLLQPHISLWWLMLTQFCYGIGSAFFEPASAGLLPQIVEKESLAVGNSLFNFISSGTRILGPALAGVIIALAGAPVAVALDGMSFLVSAISLYFVWLPSNELILQDSAILDQLKEGFNELRKRAWLLVTVFYLAFLVFVFNAPVFVLGPVVALDRLGGATAWALMVSAFGAGMVGGSFVAVRLKTERALGFAYLGMLGLVPLLGLLAFSNDKWLVVGAALVAGIAAAVFGITYPTLMQRYVPKTVLSRVASYFWLARVALTPLGLAIVGPLGVYFGLRAVFAAAALSVLVATSVCVALPTIWVLSRPADQIPNTNLTG